MTKIVVMLSHINYTTARHFVTVCHITLKYYTVSTAAAAMECFCDVCVTK